ncbi:putative ATP synthase, F0 complex, subunit G [Lupinus albus]|uniref:Putative ATP synthase, F0 complex, subunit G n=1 Tax=Lupinus albus TaxID=3870 RepID=A0A6A4NEK9_LUPAL|nr:putative ATP synthase, F0 complex, subunit G [Lupinus albus]
MFSNPRNNLFVYEIKAACVYPSQSSSLGGSLFYRAVLFLSGIYELLKLLLICCSIPHRYNSLWKELDYAKNIVKNRRHINIDNASLVALFGLECFAWFCGGEIVGRGFTLTGYYV